MAIMAAKYQLSAGGESSAQSSMAKSRNNRISQLAANGGMASQYINGAKS